LPGLQRYFGAAYGYVQKANLSKGYQNPERKLGVTRHFSELRLLRTFTGVVCLFREKIGMRAILRESTANYISFESLINGNFRKKYKLPVFLIPQKKITKMTAKMTCVIPANK